MNFGIQDISAASIVLPILISLLRFHQIGETYRPFIYLLWIGGANELLSSFLTHHGYYNAVNTNLYTLTESLLLIWFFHNMLTTERSRLFLRLLLVFFVLTWLVEITVVGFLAGQKIIEYFCSYFIIITGLPIVLTSIRILNETLTLERDNMLKNPTFLICIGLVIYFTYRTLIEASWLFANQVYDIHAFINLLCNLIYSIAVLWMQRRQVFTLRY